MYARSLNSRTLTFAVSGMLWEGSLVMVDIETGSLWSHLLGESMRGPLQGETLEVIPSEMTDWNTWKTQHPQTTAVLLSRTDRRFRLNVYRNLGRYCIGFRTNGQARAWRFSDLKDSPVVNDEVGGTPVLVVFDPDTVTAALYDRTVKGKVRTFELADGKLIDSENGTKWELLTGRAATPAREPARLKQLAGIVSFAHSWQRFHPNSTTWQPGGNREDRAVSVDAAKNRPLRGE